MASSHLQTNIHFETQFHETLCQAVSSFSIKQYSQIDPDGPAHGESCLALEEAELPVQHLSEDILFVVGILDVEAPGRVELTLQDLEDALLPSDGYLESIVSDGRPERDASTFLDGSVDAGLLSPVSPLPGLLFDQLDCVDTSLPQPALCESLLGIEHWDLRAVVLGHPEPAAMVSLETLLACRQKPQGALCDSRFRSLLQWPLSCRPRSCRWLPLACSPNGPCFFPQSSVLLLQPAQSCFSGPHDMDVFSLELCAGSSSRPLRLADHLCLPYKECLILDDEAAVDVAESDVSDELFEIRDSGARSEASPGSLQRGVLTNIDSFMRLRNKKIDVNTCPALLPPPSQGAADARPHGLPEKTWLMGAADACAPSEPAHSSFVIISSQPLSGHADLIECLTLRLEGLLIASLCSSISDAAQVSGHLPVLSLATSTAVVLVPTPSLFAPSAACQTMNDVYRDQLEKLVQFLVHLGLQYGHVYVVFEFYEASGRPLDLSKLVLDFIYDLVSEMIPHLQSTTDACFKAFYSFSSEQTARQIHDLSRAISESELVTPEEYETVIEHRYQKYMYLSRIPFFNPSKILKLLFKSSLSTILLAEDSCSEMLKRYLHDEV